MDRIRKVVARAKSQTRMQKEDLSDFHARLAMPAKRYKYTKSRVVPVSPETLLENRVVAHHIGEPISERFHILRTKILQQLRRKNWSTLAISAPAPSAGKSLVAVNLAISMAMEGNQSVLLVDMDLRKPSVHKYFGISPEYGIHDHLDGSIEISEVLINPGIERLLIMPGRKGVMNSSEQIATPFVRDMVEELKKRYESRVVIFDLPPMLVSDDVMVFLPYVDCSLLVVESGGTTPKDLTRSLDIFGNNPVLGTVLNKCNKSEGVSVY